MPALQYLLDMNVFLLYNPGQAANPVIAVGPAEGDFIILSCLKHLLNLQ